MATKWFYPLQTQLEKFIQEKYETWSCNWQNVSAQTVVECYTVVEKGEGKTMKAVIFVMYKAHKSITFFTGGDRIN